MNDLVITNPVQKNWLESIADRASCNIEEVRSFIAKYGIIQTPLSGTPRRMNIKNVVFSGTKRGLFEDDFEFTFDGLGPGIWGLFTDGNGKGKTTALEIIKWLFKGKVPSSLQSGVKSWIKSASMIFDIDETVYRIRLTQGDDNLSGAIERFRNGSSFSTIAEFSGEAQMEEVISNFMLNQFELQEISSYRRGNQEFETGTEVIHGWPALAAAMFIGTDYSAIFGDVIAAGLPGRILNMFVGLPWIPTAAALKALEGNLKEEAVIENKRVDLIEQEQHERWKKISEELKNAQEQLEQMPKPTANQDEFQKLLDDYNWSYELMQQSARQSLTAESLLDQVGIIAREDEIRLRNFREDHAANKVFKRINPKCCPHCDRKVTVEDLRREQSNNTCSVCEHEMIVIDDSDSVLETLQNAAQASKRALDEQRREARIIRESYQRQEKHCTALNNMITDYRLRLERNKEIIESTSKLEKDIFRLQILESEYSKTQQAISSPVKVLTQDESSLGQNVGENQILKAAIKETEARYKDLQQELFDEVSKKMLEYCPKVGLGQYKSITINGTPTLKIDKDGLLTSYSKVSPGEKLRLKVIALLALISVAELKGYGRHPGFLIIDSPGAQEVSNDDLLALIEGLKELCKILPSLQIVIASKASPPLLALVNEKHRKYVQGQAYLW